MPKSCPNCNSDFDGRYCSNCGQRNDTNRITLRQIVQDIFNFMFNVDSPFWITLRMTFKSPGTLSRDYISGKRRSYFHPVRYFLVAVAVYYLFVWIFDFNPVKVTFENMGQGDQYDVNADDLQTRVTNIIRKNVNLLMFAWIFWISVFDRLFYRKSDFNIAERSVHYFYALGSYTLMYSPFITLTMWDVSPDIVRFLCLTGFIPYTIMSFHQKRGVLHFLKALGLVLISFLIYVLSISIGIFGFLYLTEFQ